VPSGIPLGSFLLVTAGFRPPPGPGSAEQSAADIINELPKLSEAERRAIREALLEIANQAPDIAACNQAALEGAMMLDRMEDEDARRQSRWSLDDGFGDVRV